MTREWISYLLGAGLTMLPMVSAADTHYAAIGSPSPSFPYTNWICAATTIQEAVEAADPGDLVLVSNGIYHCGVWLFPSTGSLAHFNRLVVTNAVTVQSVNGPSNTMIVGAGPVGTSSVRCVYLSDGARLVGFMLSNGNGYGGPFTDFYGAGACLIGAQLSNCVVINCDGGGGNYSNRVYGAHGGGIYAAQGSRIDNCRVLNCHAVLGGGIYLSDSTASCCRIEKNSCTAGPGQGGGIYGDWSRVADCVVVDNDAHQYGGGVLLSHGVVEQCTIEDNQAWGRGGGILSRGWLFLTNCIFYFNGNENYVLQTNCGMAFCCTYPGPEPAIDLGGNITNPPVFQFREKGNYCLRIGSPGIDDGTPSDVSVDFNGVSRPLDSDGDELAAYDMGAYEYPLDKSLDTDMDGLPDAWETNYFADLSESDSGDPDNDGVDNLEEYLNGSDPTVRFVGGPAYYVAPYGSDANDGRSTSTPFRTIEHAARLAGKGDTIFLLDGTYREAVDLKGVNCRAIMAYSNCAPVIKGSTIETNWIYHDGYIWKSPGYTNRPQQVFDDGELLVPLGWPTAWYEQNPQFYTPPGFGLDDMTNGTFFCDTNTATLYVWLSDNSCPSDSVMEVSQRQYCLFALDSDYIFLCGLRFEHCNSLTFEGGCIGSNGLVSLGDHSAVEDCSICWGDGVGVLLGRHGAADIQALNCDISHNAVEGISSRQMCSNVLVVGCRICSNDYLGLGGGWAAAGVKVVDDCDATIVSNEVAWNKAHGVWIDTCRRSNGYTLVEGNYIHHNGMRGIFFEISRHGAIRNNLLVSNLMAFVSANSDDVTFYNNTCMDSTGIAVWVWNTARYIEAGFQHTSEWSSTTSNRIMNNIFFHHGAPEMLLSMPRDSMTSNRISYANCSDYNCFYCAVVTNGPFRLERYLDRYAFLWEWTYFTGHDSNSIWADPVLTADFLISSNSPCTDVGTNMDWMMSALDCWGRDRLSNGRVDLGCGELSLSNTPFIAVTNVASPVSPDAVSIALSGTNNDAVCGEMMIWNLSRHDQMPIVFSRSGEQWCAPPLPLRDGAPTRFKVSASNQYGLVRSVFVYVGGRSNQPVHYVSPVGSNEYPYASWSQAATSIQYAVDTAIDGDVVVVSDGVYRTGGVLYPGRSSDYSLSNRLVVIKPVVVRSANGPSVTVIEGAGPVGPTAVRCAYLANGARLEGITLRGGRAAGAPFSISKGAGVCMAGAMLSNCVVIACDAGDGNYSDGKGYGGYGGGIYADGGSRLLNCVVTSNHAFYGGGMYVRYSTVDCCRIEKSSCTAWPSCGGGVYGDCNVLRNTLIVSNTAAQYGGGAWLTHSTLIHCTIEDNNSQSRDGLSGSANLSLTNCILYYNHGENYAFGTNCLMTHCCTIPLPSATYDGGGNISNSPAYVDRSVGDYHVQAASPCIDAAAIADIPVGLDGVERPLDGDNNGQAAPDMGAYEFVHPDADTDGDGLRDTNELSFASSLILTDTDDDGANDLHEAIAGTDPRDGSDYFCSSGGKSTADVFSLEWFGRTGRWYSVMQSTCLVEGFSIVPGWDQQPGSNSMMEYDTLMTNSRKYFTIRVRKY